MSKTGNLARCFGLGVGAYAMLVMQPGVTAAQSSISPMPGNLISPLIPYEQGLANIQAQDEARPKAMLPKLPNTAIDRMPIEPSRGQSSPQRSTPQPQ